MCDNSNVKKTRGRPRKVLLKGSEDIDEIKAVIQKSLDNAFVELSDESEDEEIEDLAPKISNKKPKATQAQRADDTDDAKEQAKSNAKRCGSADVVSSKPAVSFCKIAPTIPELKASPVKPDIKERTKSNAKRCGSADYVSSKSAVSFDAVKAEETQVFNDYKQFTIRFPNTKIKF
jgi:hypothetical protein